MGDKNCAWGAVREDVKIMKIDDTVDMEESTEDEDGSPCKNFDSTILEADDVMRTNSDSNQNDDGIMDFDCNTNPEICVISIGTGIMFMN
ncbi:unnamed protein product [Litomosoides sigmodontis]|uniref:Uncharacterized protein n=1 Tax=Litomosoides sigmodontis TaxID=42156 RepID=A0A3P6T816_LITSI|nr:unnamed protein product [Litomosoides sigmodontis]